jgi:alkaline phosphatase D
MKSLIYPVVVTFIFFTANIYALNSNSVMLNEIQRLDKVALGSCNKIILPQHQWRNISKLKPDLFIFGGDNIYADRFYTFKKIERDYWLQNHQPSYRKFLKTVPIIGTWDDHDYGLNNGGEEYLEKSNSQKHFLDFMHAEQDDLRRTQEGIYRSYVFGSGNQQVKILLLDVRYFRNKATILGQKQWSWLEKELKNSKATFHLIVSGTAIFYPDFKNGEEWVDVDGEVQRLLAILAKHQPKGTLLISGDKHHSAFVKVQSHGKIWHEFMSSGMTDSVIGKKPTSVELASKSDIAANFELYVGRNFGEILFHWNKIPSITLNIRSSVTGKIKRTRTLSLKDL